MKKHFNSLRKNAGFTLIELLVVIAVIGVLAAVVLVAIDPLEQLARGRDSGRKAAVAQLGRALQAYYTAKSTLPVVAGWDATILASGDVKIFPTTAGGTVLGTVCGGGGLVNNYCYKFLGTDFVVYTYLESKNEHTKGTCAGVAANTWFIYSSLDGRGGTVCVAPGANGPGVQSFTYAP